ncbi:hypothetical protein GCM10008018_56020 [Paenibacillus marchantiophytorum]|uniref:YheC/YheD family protein n=1 Tax=Paenibacillus marchantiophytorum TaxID=1619310 RepID=A0ABQ1F8L7_9BACL|nr:YheC/YheD family protein [Paenibacillus marchantiophytorum]GGA02753.1 hypothetical protein GCM10008018_56020 [Paenibacillus marchantiophytorum]
MRNVVGILLDRKNYLGISSQQTGYEQIDLYNKAAEKLGMTPLYMCPQHISQKSVLGLCYENNKYRLVRLPIPKVTHNRAMTLTASLQKRLSMLSKSSIVFNRQNRYDKLFIHSLLLANKSVAEYLPVSYRYSSERLEKAMNRYSSLFIKPSNSSVGRGIMKLTLMNDKDWQFSWSNKKPQIVSEKEVVTLIQEKVGTQSYMIQQAISLATYQGRPYDLRISVQRGDQGKWQVNGIAGKVAASGRHVTNLAKGGDAKRCEELFRYSGFDSNRMRRAVEEASLLIVESLAERLPGLADVGLDIGVDEDGRIRLIEVNGRDQRYEFKNLAMNETFIQTYETPMRYAKFLLKG